MKTTTIRCFVIVFLTSVSTTLSHAQDLASLIAEYKTAKEAFLKAKRPAPRRGRGQKKGKNARKSAPRLAPHLNRIAAVRSTAALNFLVREYRDEDPDVAAAAGVAILRTNHPRRFKLIAGGFRRDFPVTTKVRILDACAAQKDRAALEFVAKLAGGRSDITTQAIALGSMAQRPKSRVALKAVLSAVHHASPTIRNAALRALKDFRFKDMISPLIERLGNEKIQKLRVDALKLLVRITGNNMGLEVKDWRKWWDYAEPKFEFPTGEPTGKTHVVASDLEYFGIEISSKRVAFLVDASNSMLRAVGGKGQKGKKRGKPGGGKNGPRGGGRSKMDILKEELTRILKKLPEDTYINIVFFHRQVVPWKKALHSLRGGGREEAIRFVRDLRCAFGTNIYDTLELALKDERVDTLFLLSDGRPVGGKYTEPEDIIRQVGALNRVRGATIHCISFGQETEFLKKLAAQNGGTYRTTHRDKGKRKRQEKKGKKGKGQ